MAKAKLCLCLHRTRFLPPTNETEAHAMSMCDTVPNDSTFFNVMHWPWPSDAVAFRDLGTFHVEGGKSINFFRHSSIAKRKAYSSKARKKPSRFSASLIHGFLFPESCSIYHGLRRVSPPLQDFFALIPSYGGKRVRVGEGYRWIVIARRADTKKRPEEARIAKNFRNFPRFLLTSKAASGFTISP